MINPLDKNAQGYLRSQSMKSERAKQLEEIRTAHQEAQNKRITRMMVQVQSYLDTQVGQPSFEQKYQEFKNFLSEIGYEGKAIGSLSQEEAAVLVSEEGFFGVEKTSERIAAFVLSGSNGDEVLLRQGREGILQGFKEAEALWNGKLPDISYETIKKAVEILDKALKGADANILDKTV